MGTRKLTQSVCEPGSCCRAAIAYSTCSRDARGNGPWFLFLPLMGTSASRSRRLQTCCGPAWEQTAALQLPASSSLSMLPLLAHLTLCTIAPGNPFLNTVLLKIISGLFNTQLCSFSKLYLLLFTPLEKFLIFSLLILHKPSPSSQWRHKVDTAPTSAELDSNRTDAGKEKHSTPRTLSGRTQGCSASEPFLWLLRFLGAAKSHR